MTKINYTGNWPVQSYPFKSFNSTFVNIIHVVNIEKVEFRHLNERAELHIDTNKLIKLKVVLFCTDDTSLRI